MKCPLPGGWLEPGRIRQVEEEQGWGIKWRREQESDPRSRCRSLRWFRVSSSSTCHAITWHLRPKPKQNRNIFSVSHSLAHLSSPLPLHLYTFLRCDYLPLAPLCQQSPLFWLCWLQQMLWPFSFRFGGWLAGWLGSGCSGFIFSFACVVVWLKHLFALDISKVITQISCLAQREQQQQQQQHRGQQP